MPDDTTPKPARLVSTGQGIKVDASQRLVEFPCAHPNGLLGSYVALVPFSTLKIVLGVILQGEAQQEEAQRRAQANGPRLVVDPSGRAQ